MKTITKSPSSFELFTASKAPSSRSEVCSVEQQPSGGTAQNQDTGHLEARNPEKVLRKEGRKEKSILGV